MSRVVFRLTLALCEKTQLSPVNDTGAAGAANTVEAGSTFATPRHYATEHDKER